jgi:hypothetical protein
MIQTMSSIAAPASSISWVSWISWRCRSLGKCNRMMAAAAPVSSMMCFTLHLTRLASRSRTIADGRSGFELRALRSEAALTGTKRRTGVAGATGTTLLRSRTCSPTPRRGTYRYQERRSERREHRTSRGQLDVLERPVTSQQANFAGDADLEHHGELVPRARSTQHPAPPGEPQHFLYFFLMPHVRGSFGPGSLAARTAACAERVRCRACAPETAPSFWAPSACAKPAHTAGEDTVVGGATSSDGDERQDASTLRPSVSPSA